ncbi:putative aBC transporter ATP-binding protein [Burkholderia thailandensis]|uniref:ABC transporter ATP-binding protein n=1 Tax=Burkholderia thailandensis TaxID=57975 RepID=A0AAW9CYG6_BURTH|nr:putative aBC transporter ATP-binding protein [Burkholderia thailandensis]MDW9255644.1 putative aBC transporter ATP-binding protein [Burkholderia thailandensis]
MRAARRNDGGGHGPAGSETSRAGITRIGCEGSLSASPRIRPCRSGRPGRAKHPCFVGGH